MRASFADFDAADYQRSEEAIEGFLREAETAGDPLYLAKARKVAERARQQIVVQRNGEVSCDKKQQETLSE